MARHLSFRALATLFSLCIATSAHPQQQQHQTGGEEHIVFVDRDHPAPPGVEEVLARLSLNISHPDVVHVYNNSAFHGFSAWMQSHCLNLLSNMSDVSIVEKTAGISRAYIVPRDSSPSSHRPNAPWGLQQLSSSSLVGGSATALDYTYSFGDANLGKGSDIYIVDTGIYTQHNVFNGRASMIWTFEADGDESDDDGHGTHVAGTAGGDILGVSSKSNIFGVKALDSKGGGSSATVIAGIDAVINQHNTRKASQGKSFVGSVINISLASSGNVAALESAISAAVAAGIHVVVAAGNSHQDACLTSPSSSGGTQGGAISVGAVDIAGKPASFSNFGACVDVYAPGVDIVSAWPGQPNMVNTLAGTSMATPHVVGVVAYLMAKNSTLASNPSLMKAHIGASALSLPSGQYLLVNNGVLDGGVTQRSEGYLSNVKTSQLPRWVRAGSDPPSSSSVFRRMTKRAFSAMDALGKCRRSIANGGAPAAFVGAWLCNA